MEHRRKSGPIVIRFNNNKEMIDTTIRMELKYFIARLLYIHYNKEV